LSVTPEVFPEEVSFLICVSLMQTQVSGREGFLFKVILQASSKATGWIKSTKS